MCGILGAINLNFDDTVLELIRHRGPDGAGIVRLTLGCNRITLGHRRLSIVDLSAAGDQPMETEDGRCLITYNGEVYNHQTLRAELGGTPFNGHSDTETILKYIQQYGILGVQKFNGIFAFCFTDVNAARLFLVRDPYGVKPLYYWHEGEKFVFSSEIRPLQELVHDTFSPDNLAELLRLRYSPAPDTLFKRIKKVRPGHVLEVGLRDNLSVREYSYLKQPPEEKNISFDEAVNIYGSLFDKAVKSQLMSDVEVGILLSGGIDSALVASVSQKHSRYKMKAFTVGFVENDDSDEVAEAAESASVTGLEHYVTRIGFNDFLGMMRKCVQIVEEPLATPSMIPMYALSELAAKNVKVVLSGQGADESLGGYGRYQGELYRQFFPAFLAKMLLPLANFVGVKNDQLIRGLHALGVTDTINRFLTAYTVFDNEDIAALTGLKDRLSEEKLRYYYDILGCGRMKHSVGRMMAMDLRLNLPDDLLLYTDKITMHHSLECRVPMLDLELVEFITSLPYHYRVRLRRTKIIHKAYARKVLPNTIIGRKKKGFRSPTERWFRRGDILRDLLLAPTSHFSSYFDLKTVDRVITEHEQGYNRERQIFLLLGMYYWMEEYA
jgi:asparagine synthase (glutamine-hydrolysing)